jgi:hypothetical protein
MSKPKLSVGCAPKPGGRVEIFLSDGKQKHGIEMPAEHVAALVAGLLGAAMKSAEIAGKTREPSPGASLAGLPCIVPTALGLSGGESNQPTALVVHAGMARFGIALPNPRELGQALLAVSAKEGPSH